MFDLITDIDMDIDIRLDVFIIPQWVSSYHWKHLKGQWSGGSETSFC